MRTLTFLLFNLFFTCAYTQYNPISVGINVPALMMNTLDIRIKKPISRNIVLQCVGGFRNQGREKTCSDFRFITDYIHKQNQATFIGASVRLCDRYSNDYPYISFDFMGTKYKNIFADSLDDSKCVVYRYKKTEGKTFGAGITIGYVLRLYKHLYLDSGVQVSYTSAKNQPQEYYLPPFGYSTYQTMDLFSFKGLMMQPIIVLQYTFGENRVKI
jgi:hypothetical protein